MDEPLSNLDAKLRVEMRHELRDLFERLKLTALYVTHDQEEALVLSHRMAVMHGGRVVQLGPPMDIYKEPANLFVAGFVGTTNLLEGRVIDNETAGEQGIVETAVGKLRCALPQRGRSRATGVAHVSPRGGIDPYSSLRVASQCIAGSGAGSCVYR